MNEIPHCEMQKYHYEAIRTNPFYALACQLDVLREEMMLNMPVYPREPEPIEPSIPEPEWSTRQWDTILQLKAMILHLEKRLNELELRTKKRRKDNI